MSESDSIVISVTIKAIPRRILIITEGINTGQNLARFQLIKLQWVILSCNVSFSTFNTLELKRLQAKLCARQFCSFREAFKTRNIVKLHRYSPHPIAVVQSFDVF